MVIGTTFNFKNALVQKKDINTIAKKALPILSDIEAKTFDKFPNLNSLYEPFDQNNIISVKDLAREKKILHPEIIVIVGIGGSNLGTMAVEKALIDEYEYHKEGLPKIMYADTVDSSHIKNISKHIELSLAKGNNVLIIAISKSGTTLETIVNLDVLVNSIKLYREDFGKYIVTISDRGSPLIEWANKNNISTLNNPEFVGGRYSVFSPSSLFPLSMMGLDIDEFISGAKNMNNLCLEKNISSNPALISAAIHLYHYKKKINISNTFLFGKSLEYLGAWYRQLLAESLGKESGTKSKKANVGITPMISIGTTDLHSVEQLCISGPYDKLTNFVNITKRNSNIQLPIISNIKMLNLNVSEMNDIMDCISEAVQKITYIKKKTIHRN